MGAKHHYVSVESEEIKDGDEIKGEPQQIYVRGVTSWSMFALSNLLAFLVGAGLMFLIGSGLSLPQSSESTAVSISTAPLTNTTVTSSTKADNVTLATDLAISTAHAELAQANSSDPNSLVGKILDCGYSPEEARAKGCVYDVMMQDWVPEPCYDEALTEKYLAQGNWTWYADGEGKTTIPDEVMRKGEHGAAWMSSSYHKAHCVFSWLKIVRALRNNRGISQELLSYDHVLHCSHGALKEEENNTNLGVKAPTNYAKCALYDTWRQHPIPDEHDSMQR